MVIYANLSDSVVFIPSDTKIDCSNLTPSIDTCTLL